jgi:hypothetical protein
VNGSGTAYEARLVTLLGELYPGLAPEVLAHDEARAWSLTPDAGPVLRSVADPDALWEHWEGLLPRYAETQLALAAQRSRIFATGTPDRRPAQLRVEFRRLLGELAARPIEEGGLTAEQVCALERLLPDYEHWCDELASSPIQDSLQHDDLHSNNVCWPGDANDLSSRSPSTQGHWTAIAGEWMTRGSCGSATLTSNRSAASAVGRSCCVG